MSTPAKSRGKSAADKHPILNWFIENPVSANLLMVGILLSGLYMVGFFGLMGGASKLRLEAFPSMDINTVTIQASLNGSTPEDVEQGVTNKLEEALQGIQGISKISSSSSSNSSTIWVDAITDYDMDKLLDDIKTQVEAVGGLPSEVEKVLVSKASWQPSILWVTLHGSANEKTLKAEANRLKDLLLLNPFIENVNIDGEKSEEISIEITEATLEEYNLTFNQIATAINNGSLDLSSGSIDTDQGAISLRIKDQAYRQNDYEQIIIRTNPDGSSIRLADIATVKDSFTEQKIVSEFNGERSLTLRLRSGKNTNVIEADAAATEIVNTFSKTLPKNLSATIWNNRVKHVKDRINLFVRNSTAGVLFVFLLLTLFLNLRLAFWVALGIPISFAGALLMMYFFDVSISLISLFGFILVLGIVVDDAIVIGESIYSQKKRENNLPESTIRGTSRVSTAATFGVLTTVAAFLPLTQIAGETGNILGQIGLVVIFCLIFSLVESKLILPSHLHHIEVANKKHSSNNLWVKLQTSISHGLEVLVEKTYLPVLRVALRQRYFSLLLFIAMFILAIGTLLGGILKFSNMPRIESQNISLTVKMDSTVNVDSTLTWMRKATQALYEADKVLMKEKGQAIPSVTNVAAFNTSDTRFMVRVSLAGAETRTIGAPVIANKWRETLGRIPGAKSTSYSASQRFSNSDIEIQVLGNNAAQQNQAATAIMQALNQMAGVKDIANSQDDSTNEVRIHLKPEAAAYGITKAQLAREIRSAFYGLEAERVQRGNEEVRVIVRYPKSQRKSLADLEKIRIRSASGQALPIIAVADLSYATSPKNIEHINGQRAMTISADVDKSKTSVGEVINKLAKETFANVSQQYGVKISLGGESEEDEKSLASMKLGFMLSLVMIYILLAIPLKSYTKPIIIMAVIPFGIIGAIIGHLLLGMTLSMLGLFGVIALSGVVVNDSLLLISTIQLYRDEGMSVTDAIHATGVRRFRPIILTSITTFAGLMPMLFETSFQAQFLIPMAVSLGFGILFATAITLILVPVLYYIFNDIKHLFFKAVPTSEQTAQ